MGDLAVLQNYLLLSAILFGLGLAGFLVRRNMIVAFLCVEMMLQGVSLSLVAWGRYHGNLDGQVLVVFIITVAACEAGVALALILTVCRGSGSLDLAAWQEIREEGQPRYVDRQVPEPVIGDEPWPTLTPAGIEPESDLDELSHRTRI